MIEIFEINNLEELSPEISGHHLVLGCGPRCSDYMTSKPDAPSPYFWTAFPKQENPYLTSEHIIDKEGWVHKKSIEDQKSMVTFDRIEQPADVLHLGSDTLFMFQDPRVSYAHVIMKRSITEPFANPDYDGKQIWFDLWTPYHDSVPDAERIFISYDLIPDRADLRKALKFVEHNLEKYKPMLYVQK